VLAITTTNECCSHTTDCVRNAGVEAGQTTCYKCGVGPVNLCASTTCLVGRCDSDGFGAVGFAVLDPHFGGLNGRKFDFRGEQNKVFALLSSSTVQVNARFVNASRIPRTKQSDTVMEDMCVRFCDSTAVFGFDGSVTLSGPISSNLAVERTAKWEASVSAGLWTMIVETWGGTGRPPRDAPYHNLKSVNLRYPILAGPVHGVLGVTAPARGNSTAPAHKHCQPLDEGGCDVPGEWHEYEVEGNDLCGTRFKYSQFDSTKCQEIVASLKRGLSEEVNLVQEAERATLP